MLAGANRHDTKLLEQTINAIVVERPVPTQEAPQHLCLDKGYDNPTGHAAVEAGGYQGHIRRIGEEKLAPDGEKRYPARRWVVEKTQPHYPSDTSIDRTAITPYAWNQRAIELAYLG